MFWVACVRDRVVHSRFVREKSAAPKDSYRPGERNRRLLERPPKRILDILQHPRHRENAVLISTLVETLHACDSPLDLYELQASLGPLIYAADEWRSQCAEIELRVRAEAEADPSWRTVDWELERIVADRVARQRRCVVDGLAWKALGYDRRVVMAMGGNRGQANVFGKNGFWCEVAVVQDAWEKGGHFTLHHDLTSCLRIDDLTECTGLHRPDVPAEHVCGPETHLLHEVKMRNGKCRTHHGGAQARRVERLIAAINSGAPIMGADGKLRNQFITSVEFKTHLREVESTLKEAWETGYGAKIIEPGRVVTAAAPLTLLAKGMDLISVLARQQEVISEAGIGPDETPYMAPMVDALGITTDHPPFSIYPFDPSLCAAIICDYLTVQPILGPTRLLEALTEAGFDAVGSPATFDLADPDAVFAWGAIGDRQMSINLGGLVQILYEFQDLKTLTEAMVEYCSAPDTELATGILVLQNEAATWA